MAFKKGKSGNPSGRPKGSQNKYTKFATDLFEVWEEVDGKKLLKQKIKDKRTFLKVVEILSRLMPKEINISGELKRSPFYDLAESELDTEEEIILRDAADRFKPSNN